MKYESEDRRESERDAIMRAALEDYDRRMSTRRGRFLLWLLRKLT